MQDSRKAGHWRGSVLALAISLAISMLVTPCAQARNEALGRSAAGMEANTLNGSLVPTTACGYGDRSSYLASYSGGSANGYARGVWHVSWQTGDEVRFGGAFYLPRGFASSLQGQVDLLRWDNWPDDPVSTNWGGIGIWSSDRRARLLDMGANRPPVQLGAAFDVPEGRWTRIEVHQQLAEKERPTSTVFLDGREAAKSMRSNTRTTRVSRLRAGVVAISAGRQTSPLRLWFDAVTFGRLESFVGPRLVIPTILDNATSVFLHDRPRDPPGLPTPCESDPLS